MLAHVLAVIRAVNDDRVLGCLAVAQRLKQLSDLLVNPLSEAVVQLPSLLDDLSGNILHVEADAQVLVVARLGFEMSRRNDRHGDLAFVRHPVLLRHDQRKMGSEIARKQEERLVCGLAAFEELRRGLGYDPVMREHP